ncbi:hypothetical protein P869_06045 [Ligilactobacillus ruminis S23]|nr:hypothetical protein P869_06045 [Ligilactobacillus ruminis S23]
MGEDAEKTMSQIANHPVFCVCMTIAFHDGNNPKQNVSVILTDGLAC